MNNTIKGVLWSGLVLPGLGELVLKCYRRGAALVLTVSVCMVLIVAKIVRQANDLFAKIEATGVAISTDDVAGVVVELLPDSGGPSYRVLMFIIAGCWLFSIVDVIMIAKKLERMKQTPTRDLTDSVKWE
ncbi:MAG: hypothetical protein KKG47_06570 [Proteobacteria bacterium]|nr:hypothetical protein [Pseudomonadota bacterium]MBU1739763.1 hypothetical protein [Pseudomonadota bacterium]